MRQPIGRVLVDRGIITEEQLLRVLEVQKRTHRPLGEICEDLLDVKAKDVERAWIEQYANTTRWVDPASEASDPDARKLVTRRQAWQFRVLPLGYDGAELMIATTKESLVRAMNFATRQLPVACYFVLCTKEQLGEALMKHYPMEGMSTELLGEDAISLASRFADSSKQRAAG
jgi:hypothetical protein